MANVWNCCRSSTNTINLIISIIVELAQSAMKEIQTEKLINNSDFGLSELKIFKNKFSLSQNVHFVDAHFLPLFRHLAKYWLKGDFSFSISTYHSIINDWTITFLKRFSKEKQTSFRPASRRRSFIARSSRCGYMWFRLNSEPWTVYAWKTNDVPNERTVFVCMRMNECISLECLSLHKFLWPSFFNFR